MKRSIALCLLFIITLCTYAQVGFNTPTPNILSLLDMKNKVDAYGNMTTPKGILIPRMTQAERDRINVNLDKNTHGNGLLIFNTDEDCFDYYSAKDSVWKSLCGGEADAVIDPVQCGDIKLFGRYFQGLSVNSTNYLTVAISVTTPGQYNIIARSTTDNGYYFSSSGDALAAGIYNVFVPCFGTPQTPGIDTFVVTLNGANILLQCPATMVQVEEPKTFFSMDCAATMIYGDYTKGSQLGGSNFMMINLTNVDPVSFGDDYLITAYPTAPDSSFHFTGQGILTSSSQTVMLQAQGAPALTGVTVMTIQSNSTAGTILCTDTLRVKGVSTFTLDCASIQVFGYYGAEVPINAGDSLTMNIGITDPADSGNMYIVKTNAIDGFSFYGSGVIGGVATQKVTLYGDNMPDKLGTPTFTISSNSSIVGTCQVPVTVNGPDYTLNCPSATVYGTYVLNAGVGITDSITVDLTVAAGATGFPYDVWTDTIAGLSFRGTGTLVGGTQTITLAAKGIPTGIAPGPQTFTIKTNSQSSAANTCTVQVVLVNRKITVMTLGNTGQYTPGTVGSGSNTVLTAPQNFGTLATSTVYQDGWTITGPYNANDSTTLNNNIAANSPDIIVITYGVDPASGFGTVIRRYLDAGGVVIVFMDSWLQVDANFLREVLQNNAINETDLGGYGDCFQLKNVDNPVLNGVFGDVRGLNWGQDYNPSHLLNNMPTSELTVLSNGVDVSANPLNSNTSYVTAFKHNTLNFLYFADGGFLTSSYTNGQADQRVVNNNSYPFWCLNGVPVAKPNYGSSNTTFTIQNSIIFANSMAWAANQARNGGYNKKP